MCHQTPQQQTLSPLGLPCYAEGKKTQEFYTVRFFFKWAWFKEDENDGAYKLEGEKAGVKNYDYYVNCANCQFSLLFITIVQVGTLDHLEVLCLEMKDN